MLPPKAYETPPQKSKFITYTVTFQSDKVNFHGDELFWISTEILNMFHKVSTEFIATFKYTENHNVIVSNILHDIFGQTFYPKAKIKDKCMVRLTFCKASILRHDT